MGTASEGQMTRGWSFDARNAREAQAARAEFSGFLRAHATDESDCAAAELAFGELIANASEHAPGHIDVRLDWSSRAPLLVVEDHGPGFTLATALPANPLSEGGRGLFLVAQLTNALEVQRIENNGSAVKAVLPIHRERRRAPRCETAGAR